MNVGTDAVIGRVDQMLRWFKSRHIVLVRVHVALFAVSFALIGLSLLLNPALEFGGHHVPQVDDVLGVAFLCVAALKVFALWVDYEPIYRFVFACATTLQSAWAFTTLVYALVGLTSFSRAIAFILLLLENTIIFPYLLRMRVAEHVLDNANGLINESSDKT